MDDHAESTIAHVEQTLKTLLPEVTFDLNYLDNTYNNLYQTEQRFGKSFAAFTLIALFIACIGLFGLVTHNVIQRTKEIGIRKVLGASIAHIITLLSKDFLKPILFALLIASPIAWYVMQQWLDNFAYHTNIKWWFFGLAAILAIMTSLFAVGFQSIKAALGNPVESLRNE